MFKTYEKFFKVVLASFFVQAGCIMMKRSVLLFIFIFALMTVPAHPTMARPHQFSGSQIFGLLEMFHPGMDIAPLRSMAVSRSDEPKSFVVLTGPHAGRISTMTEDCLGANPDVVMELLEIEFQGLRMFVTGPRPNSPSRAVREVVVLVHFDTNEERNAWSNHISPTYTNIFTITRQDASDTEFPFFNRRFRSSNGLFGAAIIRDDLGRPAIGFFSRRPCGG